MLFVLREIFEKLNNESIRYIHWKSNEHLEAALKGCTDLDIMVHPDDQKRFVEIIQDKGFSLYQSVGKQSYISISDYLFLDTESRKIVHIHLHNRLMVGRKFFKEYLIPVEELYFNKAVFDDNYPVKIMDPTQELVTLWIRYALKTSILKYVLSKFRISKDYLRESEWLEKRVNQNNILDVVGEFDLGLDNLGNALNLFFINNKNSKSTLKMIYKIRTSLRKYKTERFTGLKYFFVRILMISRYLIQNRFEKPIPYRRIKPEGGRIIAVVGADGSGKSTVITSLEKSLRAKVDTFHIYLGSGDGKSSLLRLPFQFAKNVLKSKRKPNEIRNTDTRPVSFNKLSIAKVVWAIVLAFEKKNKLNRIWQAKARGMIIVCDRYPQAQVFGINDGPLLFTWRTNSSKLKRKIALWEHNIYKQAESYKPDLLIKLMVDPEVAIQRKPNENLSNIMQKVDIIKNTNIPANKIVEVNSTEPLERVLNNVYTEVAKIL